jgi:conjugal transfer pilus assembly protein TraF
VKRHHIILLAVFVCLPLLHGECKQNKDFWQDRERGWFYKDFCEPIKDENTTQKAEQSKAEPPKLKPLPKHVSIPWTKINDMHPDDLKALNDDATNIAFMYPTKENLKSFRMFQKWYTDKAEQFARLSGYERRSDPELASWAAEVPTSGVARGVEISEGIKEKIQIISSFSNVAGIVVVTQRGCGFCERQMPLLEKLKKETGMSYKELDKDNRPLVAAKLGVATTPDIFLVVTRNNQPKWQRIGSGLLTLNELKQAVLFGLYALGELKNDQSLYR